MRLKGVDGQTKYRKYLPNKIHDLFVICDENSLNNGSIFNLQSIILLTGCPERY